MRSLRFVLAAVLTAALAAGCSSGAARTDGRPEKPVLTDPDAEAGKRDGRRFGFITRLEQKDDVWVATIDFAQLLTGAQADTAARKEGFLKKGERESVPYWVLNDSANLTPLPIEPSTRPNVGLRRKPQQKFNYYLEDFAYRYLQGDAIPGTKARSYRLRRSPYWITVKDGMIVALEENILK